MAARKERYSDDGRRYVAGSGPLDTDTLWCGESPGPDEDRTGLPFTGLTGEVLNACTRRIGLDRSKARVENVVRYIPVGDEPTEDDYRRDLPELIRVVRRVKPRWVLAMGRLAARAFLGEYLEREGFLLEMEWINGLAFQHNEYGDWDMTVVPIYHPAAGFYDTTAGARFWCGLGRFKACQTSGVEVWAPGVAALADDSFDVPRIGLDTETTADGGPWCYSWSKGGKAGVVYADSDELHVLGPAFIDRDFNPYAAVLHNAPADWNNLLTLGVRLPERVEDTMLLTRVTQVEPGGLKALAMRWLGEQRVKYADLIAPHEARLWADYFARVLTAKGMRQPPKLKGKRRGPAPWETLKLDGRQSLATRVHMLAKTAIVGGVSPRKSWDELPPLYRKMIEKTAGPPPVADLRCVPRKRAEEYAINDARDPYRLYPILRSVVHSIGANRAYEIARDMNPMLAEMERCGLPVDKERLRDLQWDMGKEVASLAEKTRELTGIDEFNPGSAPQVAGYLYSQLGIDGAKKTPKGADSTAVDVLEAIRSRLLAKRAEGETLASEEDNALDFLGLLAEHRHVSKLLSTNVETMWQYIRGDGCIHPRLKTGRGVSDFGEEGGGDTPIVAGRYAMEAPNLLAFPKHSKWAKRVRSVIVARPGRVILSVDLSGIEMRTMAERSKCPEMVRVFNAGEDLHARTARHLFGCEEGHEEDNIPGLKGNEVSYRYAGKTLGFLLLYCGAAYGFARQMARRGLLLSEEEAEDKRLDWLNLYDGIQQFWTRRWALARKRGYARTAGGWRRYLPLLYSPNERQREEAERHAISQEIQGDAAELLKIGGARLLSLVREWRREGHFVNPMLAIHDDFDFEVDEGIVEEFGRQAARVMTSAAEGWTVKVEARAAWGPSWGEVK